MLKKDNPPRLGFIHIGNRHDTDTYIKLKLNACNFLGIEYTEIKLDETV